VDTETFNVRVGPKGRIVLPAPIRRALGFEEGAEVVLFADRGRLVVESRDGALARLRSVVQEAVPSSASLVDELLAARHADAWHERSS